MQNPPRQPIDVENATGILQQPQPLQLGDRTRIPRRHHLGRHPARTTVPHPHSDPERVREITRAQLLQRPRQVIREQPGNRAHTIPGRTPTPAEPRQHHLGRRQPRPQIQQPRRRDLTRQRLQLTTLVPAHRGRTRVEPDHHRGRPGRTPQQARGQAQLTPYPTRQFHTRDGVRAMYGEVFGHLSHGVTEVAARMA